MSIRDELARSAVLTEKAIRLRERSSALVEASKRAIVRAKAKRIVIKVLSRKR
jgi:hypothetical protein